MHNKIIIDVYDLGDVYDIGNIQYNQGKLIPKISKGAVGDTILGFKLKREETPICNRQELNKFVLALTKYFPEVYKIKTKFTLYE